ncbi:hypothetical protein Tco_1448775, partial [Tanacetum coccineum]
MRLHAPLHHPPPSLPSSTATTTQPTPPPPQREPPSHQDKEGPKRVRWDGWQPPEKGVLFVVVPGSAAGVFVFGPLVSHAQGDLGLVVGLAAGTAGAGTAGTAGIAGDNHPHRSVSGIGCGTAGEGTAGMLSGSFGFVTRETGALIVLTPQKG